MQYDTGDTWSPCWNQPPPPPSVDAAGFHKSAGDLAAGHDINVANMSEAAAETWCAARANCSGFTALSTGGSDVVKKVYFKEDMCWPRFLLTLFSQQIFYMWCIHNFWAFCSWDNPGNAPRVLFNDIREVHNVTPSVIKVQFCVFTLKTPSLVYVG